MKKFKLILAATALFATGFAGNAAAQSTDTTTFDVTITITESCSFAALGGTDVAFPDTARGSAADVSASGSLVVNCTAGTPYNIGLDQGLHGTSVTARLMQHATLTDTIAYGLYQDAAFANNWGDTIGTDTLAGTGTGANETIPVYGQVLGGANVDKPAGNYADTITATVTY